MTDQFSVESIVMTLAKLPGDLFQSDKLIAEINTRLAESEESLQVSEVNASLNAPQDGKNAADRELQRKNALAADPEVKAARKAVASLKSEIDIEQANNKMMARQFAGLCHIAEIKSAQMNLMSKGVTK